MVSWTGCWSVISCRPYLLLGSDGVLVRVLVGDELVGQLGDLGDAVLLRRQVLLELVKLALQHLDVRKIIFGEDTIVDFSNAIAKHPFLTSLTLSTNSMTPLKVSSLFTAIKTNSSLEHIALRHFHLDDLHMVEFSQVLGLNENLMKIDLQGNNIGPSGVELLYKKLQYRPKVWKMNLSDNAAKEFHDEVKLLKTRVLYLKVNWW